MVNLSLHARERIPERLQGIITCQEVLNGVNHVPLPSGKCYVELKRFGRPVRSTCGDTSAGDIVVAVCEDQIVKTVVLTVHDNRREYQHRIKAY